MSVSTFSPELWHLNAALQAEGSELQGLNIWVCMHTQACLVHASNLLISL